MLMEMLFLMMIMLNFVMVISVRMRVIVVMFRINMRMRNAAMLMLMGVAVIRQMNIKVSRFNPAFFCLSNMKVISIDMQAFQSLCENFFVCAQIQ